MADLLTEEDETSDGGAGGRTVAAVVAMVVLLLVLAAYLALRGGDEPRHGRGAPTPSAAPTPVDEVDWRAVRHPLDCGPLPLRVLDVATADLTGDGRAEAVVVLRCDAGAGSPPSTIFVYDERSTASQPVRALATLLAGEEDVLVNAVSTEGGRVRAEAWGYSRPTLPRCCPDRHSEITWRWDGHGFSRTSARLPD